MSRRPKNKPLFLVDLVLNETGVHYSTPLENFEASIFNLFNEGILVTHNIPMLDKVKPNILRVPVKREVRRAFRKMFFFVLSGLSVLT